VKCKICVLNGVTFSFPLFAKQVCCISVTEGNGVGETTNIKFSEAFLFKEMPIT
jgi:hypothetical protein